MEESNDRIYVLFSRIGRAITGGIVYDPAGRSKIVFIKGYSADRPMAYRGTLPNDGEVWICEVMRDTRADPHQGALIVMPEKIHLQVLPTRCGGKIIVTPETRGFMSAQPEVFKHLPEAVMRISLPTNEEKRFGVEVEMGRPVGNSRTVEVERVGYDEPCLFTQRFARRGATRVVLAGSTAPVRATTVTLWATPAKREANVYLLRTAYYGKLAPREPWACRGEDTLVESMEYWSSHAMLHDPVVMGEIFASTFREVVEFGRKNRTVELVAIAAQ